VNQSFTANVRDPIVGQENHQCQSKRELVGTLGVQLEPARTRRTKYAAAGDGKGVRMWFYIALDGAFWMPGVVLLSRIHSSGDLHGSLDR
jgi:hypothetical protein